MIGRIIWGALLAGLAVTASFAQLDREARRDPSLAALVPAPLRGFAAQRLTERAIAANDAAAAARAALLLVRARPLPAEHMGLLSLAAAMNGDSARALAALEQASKRGWRDPLAQLAAGQSALLQGQTTAAAQRIAALLATGALPDQAHAMLATLLAQPGGRAAFARQLAVPGRWQGNMLAPASEVAAPDDLAQTLALAMAQGAHLPCGHLAALAQKLTANGQAGAARRFWPGDCPAA